MRSQDHKLCISQVVFIHFLGLPNVGLELPRAVLASSKLLTQHALSLINLYKQQYHLYCFGMFC